MTICNGIDDILDDEMQLGHIGSSPHYRCRASCAALGVERPAGFNAAQMLARMLAQIELNWQQSPRHQITLGPSEQNWRWAKRPRIDDANQSVEKQLEKGIARSTGDDWANQVPTASGLWNESADKHRNVDLAHQQDAAEFSLIELKVASDHLLKAIVELLHCATLYIFARLHYPRPLQTAKALLQARIIHLKVLAPNDFYCLAHNLDWLREDINAALADIIAQRHLPISMDLAFGQFPCHLVEDCRQHGFGRDQCLAILGQIIPVAW